MSGAWVRALWERKDHIHITAADLEVRAKAGFKDIYHLINFNLIVLIQFILIL